MKTLKEIFTEKYKNNSWNGKESKSGPGSSVSRNLNLIDKLELFIKSNNLRSILDCGCGDFNWMKHFNFDVIGKYTGIDIVPEVIKENANYSNRKIGFSIADITESVLSGYDIILCKDCLFHLSFEDAQKSLVNIAESGAKYLISTTFTDCENKDIKSGKWRPINLEAEPFELKNKITIWENIEEVSGKNSNKGIGIWRL